MRVTWSRRALQDLADIHQFLQGENPVAARRMLLMIRASVSHLSQHPQLGRANPPTADRMMAVARTPFVVDYRVGEDLVEIIAVTHGARRI